MALTDMKFSKSEAKEHNKPMEVSSSKREYPYGLSITLEKESLKKLKLNLVDFNIGDTVMVVAQTKVTSISQSNDYDSEDKTISLQIQKMSCKKPRKPYDLDWDDSDKKVDDQLIKDGLLSK